MNINNYDKHLFRRIQISRSLMTKVEGLKFYSLILISIMLIGALNFYTAFSSYTNIVTIRSSGKITTILPLHVEGRYIKNAINQTVVLKGVNKVEFADDPDGIWMGSTYWSDNNVKAELDAMKSWGVNVIRCHFSVELWKYDIGPESEHPASPYCSISAREAMKRLAQFAAEKGIYVIYDPYSVRCFWTGGDQDPLPFPPYQTSADASKVIGSVEDFVDWWRGVANELKNYPNVIFELWNEPLANKTAWFDAAQEVIHAIREVGASNLIVVQWDTGCWVNLDFPPPSPPTPPENAGVMDWILLYPLEDPLENIVYSTHIYRFHGSFLRTDGGYQLCWTYKDIEAALQYMWIDYVMNNLSKPVIIGEVGACLDWDDPTEQQREMIAWNNTLTIFNEWGLNYIAFWWRDIGIFRLLEYGQPWVPPPTESGLILINAIKSEKE